MENDTFPTFSTVSKEKQREVESNLLNRIHGMRETDRTQLTEKDPWNERQIEPNLLKRIHGMRER